MIVDEMSEQRKQWEGSDNDMHVNSRAKPTCTSYNSTHPKCQENASLPGLRFGLRLGADDLLNSKAMVVATKASRLFSVESEQVPSEAVCLFLATRAPNAGHMSVVDVVACTMIVAHRRTSQDIEDASLAFSLKVKNIACSIQNVQTMVLMGDERLSSAYAYLFRAVSERRPNKLVEEAMNRLLEIVKTDAMDVLLSSAWGIRSLAEGMMKHIQDCRLVGGESLQLLARAVIVLSCELHDLKLVTSAYIRTSILANHRATWKSALEMWDKPTSFLQFVGQKRHMREYGVPVDRKRSRTSSPVRLPSMECLLTREIRARVADVFASDPMLMRYTSTSISAGVTHLCVFSVINNDAVQAFVGGPDQDPDHMGCLVEVCLAAVLKTSPSSFHRGDILDLVVNTKGFDHSVLLARKFKPPSLVNSTFFSRVKPSTSI